MKKFVLYIIALAASLLIILYSLDYIYTEVYKNGLPRNKVAYLMKQQGQEIDYIFLGSSRVDNTINASIIEKQTGKRTINLGIQSAKPDDFLLLLKLIKDLEINTEKIFIQIDHSYNSEGNSNILDSYLMPYISNPIIKEHLKSSLDDYWWTINFPFYRYLKYDYKIGFREVFSTGIRKETKIKFKNGFYPKFGYSGVPLKGKLSSLIAPENIHVKAINKFAGDFHMKVIFFTAPYCPNTENLDFFVKMNKKLPNLWNFSGLLQSNNFFYDCYHLNNKGADIFSKEISRKINQMKKENF